MTIDTSKEAVERLSRMCGAEASYKTHIGTLMAQASDMLVNLAAERDAQTARADAAEAEVARRMEMHECAMAERDDCIEDWSKAKEQITRLTAELAKQMLAYEMLRGLYDDEAADVARLTAELRALRAGQDALVAAAYEAAGQEAEDHGEPGMYQAMSQQFRAGYADAGGHIASAIRAMTPSDATAALDAMLRAERNKALRDAVKLCDQFIIPVGVPVTKITDMQMGRHDAAGQINAAILAMVETEANNE